MKKITFLFSILVASATIKAQTVVALKHAGVSTFYNGINGLTAAYTASANGDTIYLPGGFFTPPNTIDKELVIYGAGHYPDSTLATEKTIFTAGFYIGENADNAFIEGIQINGDITFHHNQSANNVVIKRCNLNTINYQGDYTTNPCVNNLIIQNVINGWIYGTNAQSLLITNNIIAGKFTDMNTNVIQNNILFADFYNGYPYYSSGSMYNMNNTTIKNNIIFNQDANLIGGTGNIVKNNIFKTNWVVGANISTGNHMSVDFSTLLVNQTGNSFNYTHNYHLQNPATYVGEDATEIGIYGGVWGYKAGAVPENPHIITKSISPQTNTNGEININIKVAAQGN